MTDNLEIFPLLYPRPARRRPAKRTWAHLVVGTLSLWGCASERIGTDPVSIANPTLGPIKIAVAPAVNLSGSTDFDPDRFADLMASELSYADRVEVIPVSRVLGILSAQGLSSVESSTHALELVRLLGADAILVFAVTEYDPYDPPIIGITAQLYGTRSLPGMRRVDPVAMSLQASPGPFSQRSSPRGLLAVAQRVFDASHDFVRRDLREFALKRGVDESPYGWRKYLISQRHYVRYCCHATVRGLLRRVPGPSDAGGARQERATR